AGSDDEEICETAPSMPLVIVAYRDSRAKSLAKCPHCCRVVCGCLVFSWNSRHSNRLQTLASGNSPRVAWAIQALRPRLPEQFAMSPPYSGSCRRLIPRRAVAIILSLASLLVGVSTTSAAVRVEAYRGDPFGIGRVTIDLPQGASSAPASDD